MLRYINEIDKDPTIKKYEGIVYSIAKRYSTSDSDLQDLIQAGMLGLYKAIDTYKNNAGTKLSTWAYIFIRNEIQLLKNNELIVKINPVTAAKHKIEICSIGDSTIDNLETDSDMPCDRIISEEQARKDAKRFFSVYQILNKRFTEVERNIILEYFQAGKTIRYLRAKYKVDVWAILERVKGLIKENHLSSTSFT